MVRIRIGTPLIFYENTIEIKITVIATGKTYTFRMPKTNDTAIIRRQIKKFLDDLDRISILRTSLEDREFDV